LSGWRGRLPSLWALVLAVLLLWPVLGVGYVLSYDMVWVPDLALRPDFLGLGSGLPRAVPSDAVVAVLDEVVPGMLLQKLVLVGSLVLGGIGATRLAPADSLVGRLFAVTLFEWNPFVAERLLIGHWPVLLGYAVLPWLVVAGRRVRADNRVPPAVGGLLLLGSLSAGAGLVSAVTVLAFGLRKGAVRANLVLVGLVCGANAPWLVAGLLHARTATSDPVGAGVFALHGEGGVPGPVAALTLGGIWNTEVVPGSREGVLGWVALAVLAVLAAFGARPWRAAVGQREAVAAASTWAVGWGLATLTWAAPDLVGWLVAHVPGSGVVRDGSRLLALCVPGLLGVTSHGAADVCRRAPGTVAALAWGAALVLLPVALMPDAAGGMAGRLRAVSYPSGYPAVREAVEGATARSEVGDVLVLPFSSYRAPDWNHGHKVLDPLGRYLTPDFVTSDRLVVSGRLVEGEDSRGADVRRALGARTSTARSRLLAELGVGLVVTERDTAERAPAVAGRTLLEVPQATLTRLADGRGRQSPTGWVAAMVAAWSAFVLVGVTSLLRLLVGRMPRKPWGGPGRCYSRRRT
jgi:hypothetical protein